MHSARAFILVTLCDLISTCTLYATGFNIKIVYVLLTECIDVIFMDIRTNISE
jgi:hypothetical protein